MSTFEYRALFLATVLIVAALDPGCSCAGDVNLGRDDGGVRDSGPRRPRADECGNGVDDDANGRIDDGCPCGPGETQTCFGGSVASRGVGRCSAGVRVCVALAGIEWGDWGDSACDGDVLPATEACDGMDHDCDGAVDEGCPCTAGAMRNCASELIAPCRGGSQVCAADGTWGGCDGAISPTADVCLPSGEGDGIDQDCDGTADEPCGCDPVPEVCRDRIDNDCDGEVDERECTPDWPPADAGVDIDAGSGTVTVTYKDWLGVAAPGFPVVFQNADDSVVAVVVTDAMGRASTAMEAGGSATIIGEAPGVPPTRSVTTFTDLVPGDSVLLSGGIEEQETPVRTTVMFPTPAGFDRVECYSECERTVLRAASGEVGVCPAGGPLFCYFYDVAGRLLGQIYVPFVSATGPTDLSGEAIRADRAVSVTIESGGTYESLQTLALAAVGRLRPRSIYGAQDLGTPVRLNIPDIAATSTDLWVTVERLPILGASRYTTSLMELGPAADRTVTCADSPLFDFPTMDRATQTLAWTEVATGSTVMVVASIRASRGGAFLFNRSIYSAHRPGRVRFPRLPAPYESSNFATDQELVMSTLTLSNPGVDYRGFLAAFRRVYRPAARQIASSRSSSVPLP